MPSRTSRSFARRHGHAAPAYFTATRRGAALVVVVVHACFVAEETCLEFARQVRDLAQRENCHRLAIDTSRVELFSSAFLGVLIRLLGGCHRRGGRLVIVTSRAAQHELYRLHHLDTLFTVTADIEEALARLDVDA